MRRPGVGELLLAACLVIWQVAAQSPSDMTAFEESANALSEAAGECCAVPE